jgi:hypothetical protein
MTVFKPEMAVIASDRKVYDETTVAGITLPSVPYTLRQGMDFMDLFTLNF